MFIIILHNVMAKGFHIFNYGNQIMKYDEKIVQKYY